MAEKLATIIFIAVILVSVVGLAIVLRTPAYGKALEPGSDYITPVQPGSVPKPAPLPVYETKTPKTLSPEVLAKITSVCESIFEEFFKTEIPTMPPISGMQVVVPKLTTKGIRSEPISGYIKLKDYGSWDAGCTYSVLDPGARSIKDMGISVGVGFSIKF